jgi:PEGA domain
MRLQWLLPSLIALALGAFAPRIARAQPEVSSTAVLGLEGIDVPTSLADDIAEQLRQRVSGTHDLHLVSGRDLVEVKLVFSCADEAASCMAQAGKSLDAQKLIYGSVKKVGEDYAIWLKMFDVRKAKIEFWLTETLLKKQVNPTDIKAASIRWFAKLTGRPLNAGIVQVTANLYGATVSMDGIPVGATSEQPLTIADVAPGKHELVLSKPGHVPAKQQFMVGAGQTVPVNLTLQPIGGANGAVEGAVVAAPKAIPIPRQAVDVDKATPPAAAPTEQDNGGGHGGYRAGFWVTLVSGLASAGAGVKFGLDVKNVNKSLDPYRRFPCAGNSGQLCDTKGVVRPSLSQAEKNKVASLNSEGTRDQTLQWICVGVGSALGIASGYFFYKGYIDSDDDHARREAHQGLRIFPMAGASGGGILAEFDF